MEYKAPELTALAPAITAIQHAKITAGRDLPNLKEPPVAAYEDWED